MDYETSYTSISPSTNLPNYSLLAINGELANKDFEAITPHITEGNGRRHNDFLPKVATTIDTKVDIVIPHISSLPAPDHMFPSIKVDFNTFSILITAEKRSEFTDGFNLVIDTFTNFLFKVSLSMFVSYIVISLYVYGLELYDCTVIKRGSTDEVINSRKSYVTSFNETWNTVQSSLEKPLGDPMDYLLDNFSSILEKYTTNDTFLSQYCDGIFILETDQCLEKTIPNFNGR